jgi:hypothetical protein
MTSAISPVAFYQAGDLKPETVTGNLSPLFLGVRMECAQCHDHPFDKWTRRQFWQTAAFFASITPPEPGQSTPSQKPLSLRRQLEDPLDKTAYQARFLDDREPDWRVDADPRRAFAGWLTAPTTPTSRASPSTASGRSCSGSGWCTRSMISARTTSRATRRCSTTSPDCLSRRGITGPRAQRLRRLGHTRGTSTR